MQFISRWTARLPTLRWRSFERGGKKVFFFFFKRKIEGERDLTSTSTFSSCSLLSLSLSHLDKDLARVKAEDLVGLVDLFLSNWND